ncbi:hypothetical protein HYE67_008802 [Fusarium culmorum]|uniref:Uncharacterized protein n=1 Tax=Fusarium culmorum TaxID=5516 RepID=A0A7S8DDG9_FUSCU|nr:hypothetical protein HYE67_008802 [Fusarium culmorum]
MSYGILYSTPFIPGKHKKKDQFWCSKENEWKATNQMEWFLKEGDDISEKRSVHHDYYRLVEDATVTTSNQIYCSTTFPPPRRYDNAARIRSLCNISWDQQVDTKSLPRFTNANNRSFPKLSYRIKMDCEDGVVNFTVSFNGQKVGGREVDVQFN